METGAEDISACFFLESDGRDTWPVLQPRLKRRSILPGMGIFSATVKET
jgi:hypothetical protein